MQVTTYTLSQSILWIVVLIIGLSVIHIYKESIASMSRGKKQKHDNHGLPIGTKFPQLKFSDLKGDIVELIDEHDKRERLLIFTSLGCNVCEQLYPIIVPYQKAHPFMKVYWFVSGDKKDIEDKMMYYANEVSIISLAPDEILKYTKKLPFTYYLTRDAIVRARDVTTEEDHITELFKIYA